MYKTSLGGFSADRRTTIRFAKVKDILERGAGATQNFRNKVAATLIPGFLSFTFLGIEVVWQKCSDHTAVKFRQRLSQTSVKANATMPVSIMGNDNLVFLD